MGIRIIKYSGMEITKRVTTTQIDYFIPDPAGPRGCVLQFDTLAKAKAYIIKAQLAKLSGC